MKLPSNLNGIPPAGSHLKFIANAKMSSNPIKNTGMDKPTSENICQNESKKECRFTADLIPTGIEIKKDKTTTKTFNLIEFCNGVDITSTTGLLKEVDVPKSPLAVFRIQRTYCSGNDPSDRKYARGLR